MRLVYPALTASLLILGACAALSGPPAAGARFPARVAAEPVQTRDAYYLGAAAAVDARIGDRAIKPAKNIILFIGDGMGISTISAARIYAGQTRGVDGESYRLTMDTLPHMALSKTYSHDFQVPDSAATATAMVTGVKTGSRMLGVTSAAGYGNCATVAAARTDTLFDLAERAGLSTGLVSTARLTHATPAAAFAETPDRDWETDASMKGQASESCKDIARQLVEWPEGDGFEIALGGGRSSFLKSDTSDPEDAAKKGNRTDGRDMMSAWAAKSPAHKVVTDLASFNAANFGSSDKVLGLFELSHMQYELDRAADKRGEPSIAEMTRAAIKRLAQDTDGYVLMVEGGRIDHAHHGVNAARALADTDAFDQAIAAALGMTDPEDTLIIVTADHSHTLSFAGYPSRNNPILGKVDAGLEGAAATGLDGKPYTTLSYANGQSACRQAADKTLDCSREDVTNVDTTAKDYLQTSRVPMYSETHGGEDVAVFASGPGSELVAGVMEQHEIFHIMGRSSGLIGAPAVD